MFGHVSPTFRSLNHNFCGLNHHLFWLAPKLPIWSVLDHFEDPNCNSHLNGENSEGC